MSGPDRPAGPRRPPRPNADAAPSATRPPAAPPADRGAASPPPRSRPAPRPGPSSDPDGGTPQAQPPQRRRPPTPEAPGPRPEPRQRAPRPTQPRRAPEGVTIREPDATAAVAASPSEPEPSPSDLSGRETHTGRLRRIRSNRPPPAPAPAAPEGASSFRKRYGVPYNTQGPKVRLGFLWAVAVAACLAPQSLRPWGLAVLYGVVAGAAAAQIIDAHRGDRTSVDSACGALGGSALAVAATLGARGLGVGYLLLVLAAVVVTVTSPEKGRLPLARAGHVVAAAGICGGAAASLVLLAEYEIGALIILLVFVMVYDASDFVVGSGASNGIEGPLAGALFIAAATFVFAVVDAPPFRGVDIWSFSVLAMIACPAGQLLASALLPRAESHAPALRRLDTMLIVAPAWAGLVGLYLAQAGS